MFKNIYNRLIHSVTILAYVITWGGKTQHHHITTLTLTLVLAIAANVSQLIPGSDWQESSLLDSQHLYNLQFVYPTERWQPCEYGRCHTGAQEPTLGVLSSLIWMLFALKTVQKTGHQAGGPVKKILKLTSGSETLCLLQRKRHSN